MSQRCPGIPGSFVTIKNHWVHAMPGTALDAIHPWPDFCPWVQTAPVWASCLLWSPRSPLKVSKMLHRCVFFAAHTEEMTVWHLEKKNRHSCIHCFISTLTSQKSENWFYFLSPIFFLSPWRNIKFLFFPTCPGRCDWFRLLKKKKKSIEHLWLWHAWANVTWDQFQWIFPTRLCDQPHVGAYSGWNAGWQFGKQSLTSSGRKQKTVSNRLKLENWLWDAALFRLIGPTNTFFLSNFSEFCFQDETGRMPENKQ